MDMTDRNALFDPEELRDAEGTWTEEPGRDGPEAAEVPLPDRETMSEGRESPVYDGDPVRKQLAEIARLDPEMPDLGAILRSEAGPRFREYVAKGLDFVDAYTLAARDRLAALRDARTREKAQVVAAGKGHLNATRSRGGEGDLPVPADELELFRAMLPGTPDAEFRKYWNKSRKR